MASACWSGSNEASARDVAQGRADLVQPFSRPAGEQFVPLVARYERFDHRVGLKLAAR